MNFQERILGFGNRLRNIGNNEPLTKFSLFLIILLDIFIFSMILAGIEENTKTLSRPDEYASYECTNIISDMTPTERQSRLIELLSYWRNNYSYKSYRTDFWNAPGCKILEQEIAQAWDNSDVQKSIKTIRDLEEKIQGVKTEQNNIGSQYDTMLLEKIANQKPSDALTPTRAEEAKGKLEYLRSNLASLEKELLSQKNIFDATPVIRKITEDISSLGPTIQKTYDSLVFWYPLKRFAVEIIFILPLLLITLWWSRRSEKNSNGLQTLIASHLLGIIGIFILAKGIELIYDILPHRLLEKLYEILMSWNIIGVLYYLFIIIGILFTMGVIYLIQKKIFSPERLQSKRADHNQCYLCGEKLFEWHAHCIRCWASQEKECPSCKKMTNITSKYCGKCGEKL